MGEQSPYIELENRLRFLEQERELETARLLRLEQDIARLRLMEPEVSRLRREQVLHPEIEANFQSVNARIENRFTLLSNQITDATNRLNEIAVTTGSVRTMQRQLLGTLREQHGRMAALEEGQTSIRVLLDDIQTTLHRIAGDAPPEGTAHT